MKIRTKIFTTLLPLIILPAIGVAYVAYFALESTSTALLYKEANVLLEQVAASEKALLSSAKSQALMLSADPIVKSYAKTSSDYERYRILQPTLNKTFESLAAHYPFFLSAAIVTDDGIVDFVFPPDDNSQQDLTNILQESEVLVSDSSSKVNALVARDSLGRNALFLVKNLTQSQSSGGYYLVIKQSLHRLELQTKQTEIAELGRLAYVDSGGNPIFPYTETWMKDDLSATVLEKLIQQSDGQSVAKRVNGNKYILTWRAIENGLNVISVLPEGVLNKTLNGLVLKVAAVTGAIIFVTYFFVYLAISHNIIRPILRLKSLMIKFQDENSKSVVAPNQDELAELTRAFNDMADHLEKSHKTIQHLASYDTLTGLPNRQTFKELLTKAIGRAHRDETTLAILCVDIDNFKWVNDTFGHDKGDELIQVMSQRLIERIRLEDTLSRPSPDGVVSQVLGRFGGDEFFILLERVSKSYQSTVVARRILNEISKPLTIDDKEIFVTGSIGITMFPHDGNDPELLLRNADAAMYSAKKDEKNSYQFFTRTMNESAQKKLMLENSLRKAIETDEFELYYQPQVCARTGKIKGAEALIRWNSEEHGMVFPDLFIPLAEETGLIKDLGRWVIFTACKQNKAWIEAGYRPIKVSVNLSAKQLTGPHPGQVIHDVLEQTGLAAKYLELEITESSLMADEAGAINLLSDVRKIGVSVALDDFGTGYSSLSYLRKFPLDILKIDRAFVRDLDESKQAQVIAKSIISMAHGLSLTTVAEGVETVEHLKYMQDNDVDIIQGYYFCRPVPAADFEKMLIENKQFDTSTLGS